MSYTLNVNSQLIMQLKLAGIDPGDVLLFFHANILEMLTYKPNYGPHKDSKMRRFKFDTWILKGYFPNTPILFKCCMVHDPQHTLSDSNYYVKVQQPKFRFSREASSFFGRIKEDVIEAHAGKIAERELLTSLGKPEFELGFKMNSPKCISPKGMKVFSLNKDKK